MWSDCYVSQWEDSHSKKERGWVYAKDISCRARYFDVFAPWTWVYSVESSSNELLWDYIMLMQWDTKIVLWHTTWNWKKEVKGGEVVGSINMKGATTWPHLHLEIWKNNRNVNDEWKINDNDDIIKAQRGWEKLFFTRYDLWDVNQNDAAPCIWASGKDLCKIQSEWWKTIALTSDIRKVMWIKFGDKVQLIGDKWCAGIFSVEDEMNKRFRLNCIKKKGTNYCIKWDMQQQWWACYVKKIPL